MKCENIYTEQHFCLECMRQSQWDEFIESPSGGLVCPKCGMEGIQLEKLEEERESA